MKVFMVFAFVVPLTVSWVCLAQEEQPAGDAQEQPAAPDASEFEAQPPPSSPEAVQPAEAVPAMPPQALPGQPPAMAPAFAQPPAPVPAQLVAPKLQTGPQKKEYQAIHVIENDPYVKDGKFEIFPFASISINPRFTYHYGGGLNLGYDLEQNFAFEAAYMYVHGEYTDFTNELHNKLQVTPLVPRITMNHAGYAVLRATPIYGKFVAFGGSAHFDIYLVAGGGAAYTELLKRFDSKGEACNASKPDCTEDSAKPLGVVGGGFNIFLLRWLSLKLEVRDLIYSTKDNSTASGAAIGSVEGQFISDVFNNVFFNAGACFLVP